MYFTKNISLKGEYRKMFVVDLKQKCNITFGVFFSSQYNGDELQTEFTFKNGLLFLYKMCKTDFLRFLAGLRKNIILSVNKKKQFPTCHVHPWTYNHVFFILIKL